MKWRGILRCLVFSACIIALSTCSLPGNKPTRKYLIVDQSTGRLLSSYEVAPDARRPERIVTYDQTGEIHKTFTLTYDAEERLVGSVVTTPVQTGAPLQEETSYTYKEVRDADGNLVRTDQLASTGTLTQVFYGYDDTGTARGVVQKTDTNLMMKDYLQ